MSETSPTVPHIPGYELTERLGGGGQASVYRGIQTSMNRPVAVKVIPEGHPDHAAEVGRFLRESRVLAKLRHENIVQAIDFGEHEGIRYLVMEFVEGVSVATLLRREGHIGVTRSVEIAIQVSRALAHAGEFDVIHRDIKPANIVMSTDGRAIVVDFGLARPGEQDTEVTQAGVSMGTPYYMAPEQIKGDVRLDPRVDIYALGGTLFHMLTGRPPFPGSRKMDILVRHLKDQVEIPADAPQPVPPEVFAIVRKAMSKNRDLRYATAAEMTRDLEAARDGTAGGSNSYGADPTTGILDPATRKSIREIAVQRDNLDEENRALKRQAQEIKRKAARLIGEKTRALETAASQAVQARARVEDLEERLEAVMRGTEEPAEPVPPPRGNPTTDAPSLEIEDVRRELAETRRRLSESDRARSELESRLRAAEALIESLGTERDAHAEEARRLRDLAEVRGEVSEVIGLPVYATVAPVDEIEQALEEVGEAPMIRIPGGFFIAGEDEGREVEKPRRRVRLHAFEIDVYPVTNRQFEVFVHDVGLEPPDHWDGEVPPEEILDHPVVRVTWQEAVDYAAWCGRRLPTLLEWQRAARGTDGRAYPWGDPPDVSRLNCKESGLRETTPVDGYPEGASPDGILDMAGNVAEWVQGKFNVPAKASAKSVVRPVCGGSWRDPITRSRCAARRGYPDGMRAYYVGFRCAREL